MQTKIYLDEMDRAHGGGKAIVIATEDVDGLALFFPIDPEQTLRLCSEFSEAIERVRHDAYGELRGS